MIPKQQPAVNNGQFLGGVITGATGVDICKLMSFTKRHMVAHRSVNMSNIAPNFEDWFKSRAA